MCSMRWYVLIYCFVVRFVAYTLSDNARISVLGSGWTCIINRWRILRIRSLNDLRYLYSLRAGYKLHSTLRTYHSSREYIYETGTSSEVVCGSHISFLLSGGSDYFFPEVLKIQQVFERVNFIMKLYRSVDYAEETVTHLQLLMSWTKETEVWPRRQIHDPSGIISHTVL
jgi:hypothetical protein